MYLFNKRKLLNQLTNDCLIFTKTNNISIQQSIDPN